MMDTVDRRITRINEKIKRLKYSFWLLGLVLLIAGYVLSGRVWTGMSKQLEDQAVSMSRLASAAIQQDDLVNLQGKQSDIGTDSYDQLKKALTRMKDAYPDVAIVYLYRPVGDQLVFLADSEDLGAATYSPPGEIYHEASDDYWLPVRTGQITVTDEVSDRWGQWISVLNPIKDQNSGDLIAVFGMDYYASDWLQDAKIRTGMTALIVVLLLMVLSGFFLIYKRNLQIRREKDSLGQLNRQLIDQETLFRTLFEQSPIGMSIGNSKTAT